MKKKIFLMLSMAILLVCVFAISASAVEKDGIYYTLNGTGENAYAIVSTENRSSCTLETVVIPATIEVDGVTYKVTEIANNAFGQVNGEVNGKIKHLVIGANVSVVGEHAFRNITTLETVKIQNTDAASPISFYNAQFYNCTSLVSVEAKNAKIQEYGDHCFWLCKNLVTVEYPTTLKRIGENCFRQCEKLTTADLSNTEITEVGPWGFGVCYALTSIKFPSTLTSIGNNVFLYCPVETYVFPHNVNSVGQDTLAHQSKIKVLIMPAIDETHKINANFLYSTRPNVIIYSGDNVDFFKGQFGSLSAYDAQPFENYVPGTTYKTNTIFYGADNTCSICNGLLADTDNPCVTDCTYCGAVNIPKANPTHNIATTITYASYDVTGIKTVGCTNEGCTHKTTEEIPPLFTCLGYSASKTGVDGIAVGFTVNNKAIAEYEKATGKAIKYGVFVVSQDKLGNNDVFSEDGTTAEGVINAEIKNHEFTAFELKIVGFTGTQKDVKLAMGAYAATTDSDKVEYSYLQFGTPDENEQYYFVSYNDIVGAPSIDEGVVQ
ncbi:MAG: leucine-rich repeat domain-containing protein [Clostridia bacterium]|nr:leucine-rich repeat domain-containing protein [Clostridia bacterium]